MHRKRTGVKTLTNLQPTQREARSNRARLNFLHMKERCQTYHAAICKNTGNRCANRSGMRKSFKKLRAWQRPKLNCASKRAGGAMRVKLNVWKARLPN